MKKNLVIVCMVLCSLFIGQTVFAEIGIKAGANFATVSDSDEGETKTGLIFGVYYAYDLNDSFAIQPELLYIQNGVKVSDSGATLKWNFDYLVIPVLAKYKFEASETVKPYIMAGPYLGFKLSAKIKGESDDVSLEADIDEAKGTDFGVVFGGGVGVTMGSGQLLLEARYNLGLSEIMEDYTSKNRSFSLMVGYAFN